MKFDKIWSMFVRVIHHNMKTFLQISVTPTYELDHQFHDAEIFCRHLCTI